LGSGASFESGAYTSPQIALDILRHIYPAKTEGELEQQFESDYKKTVTFENILGTFGAGKEDHKSLLKSYFENMEPSEGYSFLALLLKEGVFLPVVFTTNFEHMLEFAIEKDKISDKNTHVSSKIAEDILSLDDLKPKTNEIIVVHLHGDLYRDEPLKTSDEQYSSLPKECERALQQLFEEHGFVVTGYRLRDTGVRNALQGAKPSKNGIFWISKSPLDEEKDREILTLLKKNKSLDNSIHGVTFDDVFIELGSKLKKVLVRKRYESKLNHCWNQLNMVGSSAKGRRDTLDEMYVFSLPGLISASVDYLVHFAPMSSGRS